MALNGLKHSLYFKGNEKYKFSLIDFDISAHGVLQNNGSHWNNGLSAKFASAIKRI